MSFQQKKKILDKLILDEDTDLEFDSMTQQIVIYISPGGVNLHHVVPLHDFPDLKINSLSPATEAMPSFLVSMPKKYRGLQYLKKNDLLIIDNVPEGKKVLGEINCIISKEHVLKLYQQKEWPSTDFWSSLNSSSTSLQDRGDASNASSCCFDQTEWHAKFNSTFLSQPAVMKKNTKSCVLQPDFIMSSDYSSSEEEEELELDEDD